MKILGTGLTGLVGSRVVELFGSDAEFDFVSSKSGEDITKKDAVDDRINTSDATWVFHFAAVTDVDAAEKDREHGTDSLTWCVNVRATQYIVEACRRNGKKLLFLSTDFVFDGTDERYGEGDAPSPLSYYGLTKYEGEKLVSTLGENGLIVRISYPYVFRPKGKRDFVHIILDRLGAGQTVASPDDQVIVPTYIDDIAGALEALVYREASGLYHAVGSGAVTPYEAVSMIARAYNIENADILRTSYDEYYAKRAPRPLKAILSNDKIQSLGVVMRSFDDGLSDMREKEISSQQ